MMNIYNTIQDIAKELNIEFDNVLKLFKNKFINNDICVTLIFFISIALIRTYHNYA